MDLKDLGYPLRAAYVAKFAVLAYNGIQVPTYDAFVPDTAPDFFVVVKDHNEADNSLKCGFNTDVHITVDIVTRFDPGKGSTAVSDNIGNQINGLLCSTDPAKKLVIGPDFNVMSAVRTLSRPITENNKNGNVIRKVIIYKHEIQQLR